MACNQFSVKVNNSRNKEAAKNYLYDELEQILKLFRYLGVMMLLHHENEKSKKLGKFLFSWCVLLVMTALACFLLKVHMDIILYQDLPFDDMLFFYGTTFFYFSCLILPYLTLFEIRKVQDYFKIWESYQSQYFTVLQKPLKSQVRRRLGLKLTLLISIVITSATTFLYLTYKSRKQFYSTYIFYIIFSVVSIYHVTLTTLYAIFWFYLTKTLKMTARLFLDELQIYQNDTAKLEEFRCLWVILRDLTMGLGNSFSLTFSWVLTFTLIIELTAVYFCINRVVVGVVSKGWIPTFFGTFYLNIFGQCAYEATEEVGSKCKRQLFELLSYQKNKMVKDKLKWFIQTISASPPVVCMSGSMTLNREFNVVMISTLVAYMVVFFQFKMSEEEKLREEQLI